MEKSVLVCAQEGRKFGLIWFGAAISLAEIEVGLSSRPVALPVWSCFGTDTALPCGGHLVLEAGVNQ